MNDTEKEKNQENRTGLGQIYSTRLTVLHVNENAYS